MNAMATKLDLRAMGLMVLLCAIWGIQQVAIKVTGTAVPPLLQAAIRSIGAVLLLWGWCAYKGERLFERDGTLKAGIAIALLFSLEFALIFAGLRYTTASRSVLFLYTAPFFIALSAPLLLPGEKLGWRQWLGLLAAFGGVATLFGDHSAALGEQHWLGDIMILVAAAFWAATTLTIKKAGLTRISSNKVLFYQLAGSALFFPVAAWIKGESLDIAWTPAVTGWMLYQVVLVAFASYVGWFWLIKHYPATRLSVFSFLTPVFGVLSGIALLGEPLSPAVIGALLLVGGGIALVNLPQKK